MTKATAPASATEAPPRAQVTLDGKTYVLAYDWEAFARFADAIGCTIQTIGPILDALPVSAMPVMIWAGLAEGAPDVTPEAVQAALKKDGLKKSMLAVGAASKAFQAAMADDDEAEAASDGKGVPPKGPPAGP